MDQIATWRTCSHLGITEIIADCYAGGNNLILRDVFVFRSF